MTDRDPILIQLDRIKAEEAARQVRMDALLAELSAGRAEFSKALEEL